MALTSITIVAITFHHSFPS